MYAHRGLQHQGSRRVCDENTMVSFRLAVEHGMGFECDVRMSFDMVPVVVHDRTLWRTHGVRVRVCNLVASELSAYNVPTVEEVLSEFQTNPIIFDIKEQECIQTMSNMCRHLSDKIFLFWSDKWVSPRHVRCFRAAGFRFPHNTTSSDGIACKFNGSIVNRGCIDRALDAGKHVNLFSPDKRNVKRMLQLYGQHERCTITL